MTESLRIDLADLGEESLRLEASLPPGELDFSSGEIRQIDRLEWLGSIERKNTGFRLLGELATQLELQCVRCLDPVREPVRKRCDLFFERRESLTYDEGDEIELGESDTQTAFIAGTELALGDVIKEQVLLAVPMKPLCRSECRGLCPICGTNLNRKACGCSIQQFNPAFEALRQFKKQLEERRS